MRSALAAMLLAGSIGVAAAQAPVTPAPLPAGVGPAIAAAKARALASDLSFDLLRELVTEVGPRPTGWEGEARARDWAVAKLKALGFTNVHVEPFTVPAWRRISERFEITAPFRQPLVGVALGWSAPTPSGGIEAEIVRFADLAALHAAPAGSLADKIAFVDEKMARQLADHVELAGRETGESGARITTLRFIRHEGSHFRSHVVAACEQGFDSGAQLRQARVHREENIGAHLHGRQTHVPL